MLNLLRTGTFCKGYLKIAAVLSAKQGETKMGLLDFACDVGRQIFDTDAEAADNIKQHLEIQMTGIKNIDVKFDDGIATICGDCDNQKIKDRLPSLKVTYRAKNLRLYVLLRYLGLSWIVKSVH